MVSNKKEKNKGRNKNRPPPMKFQRSSKLCPVLVKVSSETTDASESSNLSVNKLPTCTFPNCQFQHDVNTYLQNKVNNILVDLCARQSLSIFVKQRLMYFSFCSLRMWEMNVGYTKTMGNVNMELHVGLQIHILLG